MRTLKDECVRRLAVIPLSRRKLRDEIGLFVDYYNDARPHEALQGRTPNEVYYRRRLRNRAPRFEPRPQWPRPSPCARPQTLVKGQPGAVLTMTVRFTKGRKHLPAIELRRAA
jgi:hypothetical protein